MIRTFIDSGVLIDAARGKINSERRKTDPEQKATSERAKNAFKILGDRNREFASSPYIKLEILPKCIYNQHRIEAEFYQEYFNEVTYWSRDLNKMFEIAYQESLTYGVSGMDALHIAAALLVDADVFITNEKISSSIFRTRSISVISIRPPSVS
jgi:hypothetical protein